MKSWIIAAVAALAIAAYVVFKPAVAPQVHFATLAGNTLATSDLRGKVVLVNFWATWCADCIKEMPKMIETHRKYAARGYEVVAVAVQSDGREQVAAFTHRVRVTPVSVLIDRQGHIVKRYVGKPDWAELHAQLEKLL